MSGKKTSTAPRGKWVPMFDWAKLPAIYVDADGKELGAVTGAFGGGWIATVNGVSSAAQPSGEVAMRCVEEGRPSLA
ncbi:MAG: hypothetical protein EPN36_14560 [Rhodanobacteraceae bacterium]|nr:MAG: hypothetical protein EPN36_14560 [Rhodanobacteraceae bacterium]